MVIIRSRTSVWFRSRMIGTHSTILRRVNDLKNPICCFIIFYKVILSVLCKSSMQTSHSPGMQKLGDPGSTLTEVQQR